MGLDLIQYVLLKVLLFCFQRQAGGGAAVVTEAAATAAAGKADRDPREDRLCTFPCRIRPVSQLFVCVHVSVVDPSVLGPFQLIIFINPK